MLGHLLGLFRMISSTPGLYPLDDRSILNSWQTMTSLVILTCPLNEQNDPHLRTTDLIHMGQLISNSSTNVIQWEKNTLSNKVCCNNHIITERNESFTMYNIAFKWIIYLNIRAKIMTPSVRKHKRKYLQNIYI